MAPEREVAPLLKRRLRRAQQVPQRAHGAVGQAGSTLSTETSNSSVRPANG